jgi:hypothetical protein
MTEREPSPDTISATALILDLPASTPVYVTFFETESHYVGWTGQKFMILLPQPPKLWDYKHTHTHSAQLMCHLNFP